MGPVGSRAVTTPPCPVHPHCGPAPHRAEATLRSWSHPWGSCLPTGHPDSHLRPPGAPGQAHEAWQQDNPMKPPMAIEPLWGGQHVKAEPSPAGCLHVPCAHCGPGSLLLMGCRTLCLQISRVDLPASSENTAIPVSVGLFTTLAHIVLPEKLPTAPQTAQHFLQHTFWCYSPPDSIINEQVPRFTARYWRELMGLPQRPTRLSPAWPTLAATLGSRLPFPQGAALHLLLPGNA